MTIATGELLRYGDMICPVKDYWGLMAKPFGTRATKVTDTPFRYQLVEYEALWPKIYVDQLSHCVCSGARSTSFMQRMRKLHINLLGVFRQRLLIASHHAEDLRQ